MANLAQCKRWECSQCSRVGGCGCSEALIVPEVCVHCCEENAYQMTLRMTELNENLRELGVLYRPSKDSDES